MKFTKTDDQKGLIQKIHSSPLGIQYNNIDYYQSIIIENNVVIKLDNLNPDNIIQLIKQSHLNKKIEFVLFGIDHFIPNYPLEIEKHCHMINIGLEVMSFSSACKTYNLLALDKRNFLTVLSVNKTG